MLDSVAHGDKPKAFNQQGSFLEVIVWVFTASD